MSEFKAGNGWHIDEDGDLVTRNGWERLVADEVPDGAKFFQELRDHELNRWRDTTYSFFVVYSVREDIIRVVDERDGASQSFAPGTLSSLLFVSDSLAGAAYRYYQAHPVRKPLPTEDGLYVGQDVVDMLGVARVFRLRYGEWSDVGRHEDDPEGIRDLVQGLHDKDGLVRLVPEGGADE